MMSASRVCADGCASTGVAIATTATAISRNSTNTKTSLPRGSYPFRWIRRDIPRASPLTPAIIRESRGARQDSTGRAAYNEDEVGDGDEVRLMWQGFDPEIKRDLAAVKALVRLSHQTPTREWPLVFVEDYDALLVVR